jgi:hypothetical protein
VVSGARVTVAIAYCCVATGSAFAVSMAGPSTRGCDTLVTTGASRAKAGTNGLALAWTGLLSRLFDLGGARGLQDDGEAVGPLLDAISDLAGQLHHDARDARPELAAAHFAHRLHVGFEGRLVQV